MCKARLWTVLGREVMLAKVPLLRQPLQLQHDDDIAAMHSCDVGIVGGPKGYYPLRPSSDGFQEGLLLLLLLLLLLWPALVFGQICDRHRRFEERRQSRRIRHPHVRSTQVELPHESSRWCVGRVRRRHVGAQERQQRVVTLGEGPGVNFHAEDRSGKRLERFADEALQRRGGAIHVEIQAHDVLITARADSGRQRTPSVKRHGYVRQQTRREKILVWPGSVHVDLDAAALFL